MIPLLRLLFAAALSSLLICAILLSDWSASGIPPWESEGPWACVILAGPPIAAVAVLVVAWAIRRLVWLVDKIGIPMPHAWLLAEAEERGEAPA